MFKRKTDAAPAPAHSVNDAVQQARTRARQRLIGAAVLLVIGIIGFPLVFESQPRPGPVDIEIDIPRKDSAAPLVMPAERTLATGSSAPRPMGVAPVVVPKETAPSRFEATGAPTRPSSVSRPLEQIITETPADAGRDVTVAPMKAGSASATVVAKPASMPASVAIAATDAKRKADTAAAASTGPSSTLPSDAKGPSEGARARALLEGKPVAAAEAPRFVVQVGAFAEADAAREVRLTVEKLGMKTYTQIAQTPSGSRIRVRVGPFASRDEADRALAKARAAGISANVLTL